MGTRKKTEDRKYKSFFNALRVEPRQADYIYHYLFRCIMRVGVDSYVTIGLSLRLLTFLKAHPALIKMGEIIALDYRSCFVMLALNYVFGKP